MVRQAKQSDLDQVMELIAQCIARMSEEGNPQWDEDYPARRDFEGDVEKGNLFVCEEEGVIAGVTCINREEPEEYRGVSWSSGRGATVVHHLAVSPAFRGRKLGRILLRQAEEVAGQNGTCYLKADTYGSNGAMNALLRKEGYALRGHMTFLGKPEQFNCYDKILEERDSFLYSEGPDGCPGGDGPACAQRN